MNPALATDSLDESTPATSATTHRVRFRFTKRGDARFLGHHDLVRSLERMTRRARLPLVWSQGFNPRPRIAFAQALALGIEGLREIVEIDFAEALPTEDVLRRLRAVSHEGLEWLEATALAPRDRARVIAARYGIHVPAHRRLAAATAVEQFLAKDSYPLIRRKPGPKGQPDRIITLDLRSFVPWANLDSALGRLTFQLRIATDGSARPDDVLEALQLADLTVQGAWLAREDLLLADEHPPDGSSRAPAAVDHGHDHDHGATPADPTPETNFPEYSLAAEC